MYILILVEKQQSILSYVRHSKIYKKFIIYDYNMVSPIESYTIFCFWTEKNEMSINRKKHLDNLINKSMCNVVLVTPENLQNYILPDHPLHPAYKYLSAVHKADYLRTYFMNFYGGGYSDIKGTSSSWKDSFDDLNNSDKWICGYQEIEGGVAYQPYVTKWRELLGNGAYICKKDTQLTNMWYNEMINLLDQKLSLIEQNPAAHTRDCFEQSSKYPIEWNEMLGRIFHKYNYKFKDKCLNSLPMIDLNNYI